LATFVRRVEDFVCVHCGKHVSGNGYTDHCTSCLWSKHVDVNPGDRQATCGGMMKPIGVEPKGDGYRIQYRCTRCGYTRYNRSAKDDNIEAILAVARNATRGAA
jgi:DNA-directed RNA polymerase subunit RPC12/RpoP